MIVRPYTETDLIAVCHSWEAAARVAHPFMSEEFLAQERANLADVYMPNSDVWIAEIAGNVEGFIALMGNEIGGLFLHPDHHGKGAGKALMDKAQQLHGDLEVEVFKNNAIGRKFYARYGFKFMEEKHHEPTGEKLLRLKFTKDRLS